MNAQKPGQLALKQMQLQPAPFDVFSERFRGIRAHLGALPEARVRVAKGRDLQVTKWQHMARAANPVFASDGRAIPG